MSSLGIPAFLPEEGLVKLAEELPSRVAEHTPTSHDPFGAVAKLVRQGLFAHVVPEALGGAPSPTGRPDTLDVRALCLVREALAYRSPLADSIFAVQGLGSYPLVLGGDFPGRDAILREVAKGERVCAFALTEPEAGSDVASMRTVAEEEGGTYYLTGEKIYISNVGLAHHYVVFANAEPAAGKKGISAFLVSAREAGLELVSVPVGGGHPLGRLVLTRCKAERMIGEKGQGLRLALGTLDVFRTSVGAAACGMARRALDETLAHVRSRSQFGKRLVDFQLTQAALAEMWTKLEAARLLVYRAAHAKDTGHPDASLFVAMAKLEATESAQLVIDRAVQLHGGSGVVEGSVVEQLYRDVRPLRIYEGTSEIQKLILGAALAKP
ncbi:MAG: acyl-CoA dehydrogenase family protein [Polyangiaceae bacterium]